MRFNRRHKYSMRRQKHNPQKSTYSLCGMLMKKVFDNKIDYASGDKDNNQYYLFKKFRYAYISAQLLSIFFIGVSYIVERGREMNIFNSMILDIFCATSFIYLYLCVDVFYTESFEFSNKKLYIFIILLIHHICFLFIYILNEKNIFKHTFFIVGVLVHLFIPFCIEFTIISTFVYNSFINYMNKPILPR